MYGSDLADVYDLIYRDQKDYAAEARSIADLVRTRNPAARSLLDVACGTGEHLLHLRSYFDDLAGLELSEPMLAHARDKLPGTPLHQGDMREFDLGRRFDTVCCMFSSIGYLAGVDELHRAVARMTAHVAPGGLLVVEPWLTPDIWRDGYLSHESYRDGDRQLVRMSHSSTHGRRSRIRMHYLLGEPGGIRHFTDEHDLTLFTREEYERAFTAAGCRVEFEPGGPTGRGLLTGTC
jgi:dTDP-3-amino-3,4,6-trideoxy-alpha-D-glucopyranose N,N-dimethyltransferase